MAGHSHRSTLKTKHKAFKSRHSSKSAIKAKNKGKIEKIKGNNVAHVLTKQERKNLAKQIKQKKIATNEAAHKVFQGQNGAEKIVVVIPLTPDLSAKKIVEVFLNQGREAGDTDEVMLDYGDHQPFVLSSFLKRFKQRVKFIVPDLTNILAVMDAAKVADYVVFGLSAEEEVDENVGEQWIRAIENQGVSNVFGVIPNLDVYEKAKHQTDVRNSLFSFFRHFFPNEEKLYALSAPSEALTVTRMICQKLPKGIAWRDSRGYLVADSLYEFDGENIAVEGTVRGIGFYADRLIHIPNFGDYQITRIEELPSVVHASRHGDKDEEMAVVEPKVLSALTSEGESLDELAEEEYSMDEADQDEMESGQNGAIPLGLADGAEDASGVRLEGHTYLVDKYRAKHTELLKKRMKKGMSEYQARWHIYDSDEEEDSEEGDEDDDVMEEDENMMDDNQSVYAPTEAGDMESEMFVELNEEEEARQLQAYRAREKDDREFPDEMELPPTVAVRERLKRYRGVKNLYNCDWDYDEADPRAPEEWRKLLRIGNYKATRNRVIKESTQLCKSAPAGTRVRILIRAPQFIVSGSADVRAAPFVVYGLHEYEHKLSVVNFTVQPWEGYEDPVPSKDTLVVQYGFRRQIVQPLYSQMSNSPNNVHKYERFLHKDSMGVATFISPIVFSSGDCPALFFKPGEQPGDVKFVGTGSLLNSDFSRILSKRVVLTGHPFKIHKKVVTIRYMFFNPEDVAWYKAVPLFTKTGKTGFIKESLGTHGYFKATFDGRITSQDTVGMALYKRVWPKVSSMWTGV